ncbi:hypothetical protein DICSQDRAFT_159903, partial [Dichomitus squalens LYAD-421 SS1]|uniref:uncharacterized protein n=1 Tax=Dichomitus squalens (strain LYAD-421) TaxID=732165 RepID=UPI0004413EB8
MKFAFAFTALAAVAANAATISIDKRTGSECAGARKSLFAYERPFVGNLYEECNWSFGTDQDQTKLNPWNRKICVAAAVVAGLPNFHDGLICNSVGANSTDIPLPAYSKWPNLDYNVYADIVGECAWASGGCPITQQNFIDLVYSAISQETADTPVYPDSADTLIKYYLKPIFDWTAFSPDAGIPYTNFNDWLHYSGQVNHCVPNTGECDSQSRRVPASS